MSAETASPTPTSLLFYGILTGDAAQVEAALNMGASAIEPEANFWEMLENAIDEGNTKVFHGFFRPEFSSLHKSSRIAPPRPPLYFAVKRGHYDVALLLIDRGADANWTAPPIHEATGDSFALLPLAVQGGDARFVSALLRAGADVNETTVKGMNALRVAVKEGNVKLGRLLLATEADARFVAPNGVTLLMEAAGHGSLAFDRYSRLPTKRHGLAAHQKEETKTAAEILQELEDNAAPPEDFAEIARLLLAHGASVNAVIPFGGERQRFMAGMTALQAAASADDTEMARLLLDAGADPNPKGNQFGTPLTSAVGSKSPPELLHLLHERGANVNQADQSGTTPLMAAAVGRADLTALLISWGADIHARRPSNDPNEAGEDAFLCAVCAGNADCAALLLGAGADINARYSEGRDALMIAAYKRRSAIVRLLLDRGVDPTRHDDDGKTALHWAQTPTPYSQKAGQFVAKLGTTPEQIKTELLQAGSDESELTQKAMDEIIPKLVAMRIGFAQSMQANMDEKLRREAENQAEILQMLSETIAKN